MARRDRRRATTGALAASILVHIALFVVLAHQFAPTLRAPGPEAEPDFELQLVHEPPPPAGAAPLPAAAPRHSPRPPPASIVSRLPPPPPASLRRPRAPPLHRIEPNRPLALPPRPPLPAPPSARPAQGSPQRTAPSLSPAQARPGSDRWKVEGEDGEDRVRQFLRATVGCPHADYLRFTDGERAACDRAALREARAGAARVDALSPESRAAFEAEVRAREQARAGRTGPVQDLFVPCKGQGSNLDRGCINMKSKHPEDEPN